AADVELHAAAEKHVGAHLHLRLVGHDLDPDVRLQLAALADGDRPRAVDPHPRAEAHAVTDAGSAQPRHLRTQEAGHHPAPLPEALEHEWPAHAHRRSSAAPSAIQARTWSGSRRRTSRKYEPARASRRS